MKYRKMPGYLLFVSMGIAIAFPCFAEMPHSRTLDPTRSTVTDGKEEAKNEMVRKKPGRAKNTTSQMMMKLKAKKTTPSVPSAGNKIANNPNDQKYEIAECGSGICCSYTAGDSGSTCNMFKILCNNAGGTATGGADAAMCSDWP